MRLGTRVFIAYLVISVICFYYPVRYIVKELRTFFSESVEDSLADQANILASIVGTQMETGCFKPDDLYRAFETVYKRSLKAKIHDFMKTSVDQRVYITDTNGKVVFDSEDRANIGADYSRWRDVAQTLGGEYGARASRKSLKDPTTSVFFVAAPIVVHGKTAGVLTVAKPTTNINAFFEKEKPKIFGLWSIFGALAIVLAFLLSLWIARPIKRLTEYANDVREGKRVSLPELPRSELREMGRALENMRESLEGKKYVEEYINTMTHEIKSPLSAIRGAAELMEEQMPDEQRARFLANIRSETNRIQAIVDRMLELSELENRKTLQTAEPVSLGATLKTVIEGMGPLLSRKGLSKRIDIAEDVIVKGDAFLLYQAVSNLIQNAIDFSPPGGRITLTARVRDGNVLCTIEDEGPGIPDYAKGKVFEKFYSLQRPDTGKKSTGLGLNFVKEAAALHGGEVKLENLTEGGLRATLILPL